MSLSAPKLPDLTNKGDFAVFGLGYAFGFGADIVLFGAKSSPPPLTVALVFAIACLAIKSGYEEWLRAAQPSEQSEISGDGISEEERREHLKSQLDAFGEFLRVGAEFTTIVTFEDEKAVGERWTNAQALVRHLWESWSRLGSEGALLPFERRQGRQALLHALLQSETLDAPPPEDRTQTVSITAYPPQGVVVEERWEPNPNYSPQTAEEQGELPYRLHRETVDLWARYWTLRSLWEKGLLTNEYVETHLNELIDLLCRNPASVRVEFTTIRRSSETESSQI